MNHVHLVETSPAMRALQNEKLDQNRDWSLSWHDSIDEIPETSTEYTMIVAHEFFDALPINVLEVKSPCPAHLFDWSKPVRKLNKGGTKL